MHLLLRDQLLLVVQATGLVLLCIRMSWIGLRRVYPYFFVYLLLGLLQIVVLFFVPYSGVLYRDTWVVSEGLIVCFYALVVLELYSAVLRNLVGIARLSRRYIEASLALAVVASLLLLVLEKSSTYLATAFIIFERAVVFSLVIFVLLVSAFLAYYPVPLARNVIVYSSGYVVYFLAKATMLFLVNRSHQRSPIGESLVESVSAACLFFWLFALNRRGEEKTVVVGHRWNPGDDAVVLLKLQALNDSLVRSARK